MHQNHVLTRWWHSRAVRQKRRLASPKLWYRWLTAQHRRLPEFVIAGTQKGGTTSLFGYLEKHPQCAPSSTKEVHYFDKNFYRGETWYRTHFALNLRFPNETAKSLPFESSPYYMCDPRVPERMRTLLPNVKVIFLLRNPITRAFSHYQHSVLRRREPLSFEDAIAAESERLAGEEAKMVADPSYQSLSHQHYSYTTRGVYVDQLTRWYQHFSPKQLLVLEAEQMFKEPREVFAEVLRFLELDAWEPTTFENLNCGRYKATMSAAARERLEAFFAPHNRRLSDFLNRSFSWNRRFAA